MKRSLLTSGFFLLLSFGNSQEKKSILINGDYDSQLLVEFFSNMESQSPYFFYYNVANLDSLRVTIKARNEPIQTVLEKAFTNTDLLFSIDSNKIYVTKGLKIVTRLPEGFFKSSAESKPAYAIKDSLVDYGLNLVKKGNVTSESKLYQIGTKTNTAKGNAIITGKVRNATTGEPRIIPPSLSIITILQ